MNTFEKLKPEDLIISSEGFGILRKALIENMGQQKAKKFLIRFGYQLGVSKANQLKEHYQTLEELIKEAPKIHTALKHVSKVETFGSSLSFHNKEQPPDDIWGIWHDSFEVLLHLKDHGLSHECTCYTLSGFASGYLSTVHNIDIYAYEETCRSRGDEQCTFRVKTRAECERLQIDLALYDESTIIEELELTYDRLYEHKALLDKVSSYHSKLTDAILQHNDINHILLTAYKILEIPIYITDAQGYHLYSYGLTDDSLKMISKKTTYFKQVKKSSAARIGQFDLITTPIYLDNSIYGTVSFIYLESSSNEDDYLFLERLSVVASLYFLNDKVRFETTERLKISFLDRLIHEHFTNQNEMFRHSQYIQPSLKAPYCIISINYKLTSQQIGPFDLYHQIFQLARLLSLYKIDGLISLKDTHLIVLTYNVHDQSAMPRTLSKILAEMQKTNSEITFKAGVSDYFDQLEAFNTYMIQAEQAMNFPRQQEIIYYNELGLLGTLIGQIDGSRLKDIAKRELGALLNRNDKNHELLYTLYIFLKNNGHLEKTMHDLSLSIGGIKYRISKIEKMINKDLRDALVTSYLLVLIESLLTLNEIRF